MKESTLRDMIAKNIENLKEGLTLLKKEQYIPNELGTKSFIDLYAKDNKGRHVLIELKRSDAAARQAIHEVNKYVEGVKRYFGVKDNEIHVIIASTEWDELLVPFSRFTADTSFSIEGIKIYITNNETDFTAEPVKPLPITNGRFIVPWHDVYWYSDKKSLEKGIDTIKEAYKEKGIEDYIIVTLCIENQMSDDERKVSMKSAISKMAEITDMDQFELPEIPVYGYIAYTSKQMLTKEKCLQILSKDKDVLEDVTTTINDMDYEESLCHLHECVESLDPTPDCDDYEIGYPAKFSGFIGSANCKMCGIIRNGTFKRNSLLSDETILEELEGKDGSTGEKFKRTVDMQNRADVTILKKDISASLSENKTWKNHILRIIEEIEVEFPASEINISIFNPGTGVLTIYFATTKEMGYLYIPSYHIIVKNPNETRMYYGALQNNGHALTFSEILQKYYDGHLDALLLSFTWGGGDSRDSEIINDLGILYKSFRCDIDGDKGNFYVLSDDKWKTCDPVDPILLFGDYIEKNEKLIHQIKGKILPHDMGSLFDTSPSELALDKYVDQKFLQEGKKYFDGAPNECDLCHCPFDEEKYMIDGKIQGNTAWAYMCADCFKMLGEGIEYGKGQLYMRDEGKWVLVGGFAENHDINE